MDDHTVETVSPNGSIVCTTALSGTALSYSVTCGGRSVIEPSLLSIGVDGVNLTESSQLVGTETYRVRETYPSRGVHSQAINAFRGTTLALRHTPSDTEYELQVRVFDDGIAFRFVIDGDSQHRVPEETSEFTLSADSQVWYHDFHDHYEGTHVRKRIADVGPGEWAAPPLTIKLPDGWGYAAITEAALVSYPGMGLQFDGHRGFKLALGHRHPISYPFELRYSEDIARLAKPAAISGVITTPWRVVLIGADLNALVNCDIISNLCSAPDGTLFPDGLDTEWVKPGRAVWAYLDGGERTLEEMKRFSRMAGDLGFEYNVIEGFWRQWTDDEIRELVSYSAQYQVGIWLWRHTKQIRDPEARREFLRRCHDLGVVGVKLDFFDHEAKEIIDLYQTLLRETAEAQLLVNFHGSNKPTGESRTWPNELTREAVRGMEYADTARAAHNTRLPVTRLLAGHADYTPVHFGDRLADTTAAHQIASAIILGSPLLTYAAHPEHLLANLGLEVIKSISSVWDETRVLPPSEIGEIAIFARRNGETWFLAVMNGPAARVLCVPLSFLGGGSYSATLLSDRGDDPTSLGREERTLGRDEAITLELRAGGGYVGRFQQS